MRPIKFRGRNGIGEYVYGYYVPWHLCPQTLRAATVGQCRALNEPWTDKAGLLDGAGCTAIVEADSLAQLCGYDAAGNEVYEGDEVNAHHSFGYHTAEELVPREPSGTAVVGLELAVTLKSCGISVKLERPKDYQFLKKGGEAVDYINDTD